MRRLLGPILLAVATAVALGGASARADDIRREGDYGGVRPGAPAEAKPGKPRRPPPKDALSWLGFSAKDGGAELFAQARSSFTVVQWVEKGQVVVVLEGLRRQVANTRRPLDTRFFDSPIARVTARAIGARAGKGAAAHKAGIELRISFKDPKQAHELAVRTATEADGMFYAYLSAAGAPTPNE
ncbi:MAG: hypothetical protein K8W52_05550 [Deltaproteobacteria bacterium]|nr:hypothetical protein [Deltaproteobacteria bacterium]